MSLLQPQIFSCISLLLDHLRVNPSTNKIFCLPWMSWNTTALRNYFVVLFKGYVLQLIPVHHDIYRSAFCKKAANLGEGRKHPEFKVILAVLQEICVCQRREMWKAQGRGRAESPQWVHGRAHDLPSGTEGHTGPRGDPVPPIQGGGLVKAVSHLCSPPWGCACPMHSGRALGTLQCCFVWAEGTLSYSATCCGMSLSQGTNIFLPSPEFLWEMMLWCLIIAEFINYSCLCSCSSSTLLRSSNQKR